MKRLLWASACAWLCACQPSVKTQTEENALTVVNYEEVTEEREVKLSELLEDLQVIQFEDNDDAFFKMNWMYFSENYICIRQSQRPLMLFDKSGKFIGNVGGIGQGPGEYSISANDVVINEKRKTIYVLPVVGNNILTYDLQGKFKKAIQVEGKLNKGRLFQSSDDVLSFVHLSFSDLGETQTGGNIQLNQSDSIQYLRVKHLGTNIRDQGGKTVGFNHEVWNYRNAKGFPFMMTHTDTLYHYNHRENTIHPRLTMKIDRESAGISFFILNELPLHYLIPVVGKRGCTILVDKQTGKAEKVTFINDFMGNMKAFPRFQDGYFFLNREPGQLKEELEEHLASGDCPDDQKEKLRAVADSLDEDANNVLFLGKLKGF